MSENKTGLKLDSEWKRTRAERVAKIQALVDKKMMPSQIGRELGMTVSQVSNLVRRYCKRPADYYGRPKVVGISRSIALDELSDTSHLTPEQVEYANRLGISLGRYAWLMTCPRNTSFNLHQRNHPSAYG